jgi:hypothetical protein
MLKSKLIKFVLVCFLCISVIYFIVFLIQQIVNRKTF